MVKVFASFPWRAMLFRFVSTGQGGRVPYSCCARGWMRVHFEKQANAIAFKVVCVEKTPEIIIEWKPRQP